MGKLISSPSDYPRANICDRCVLLCGSILRDGPVPRDDAVRLKRIRAHEPGAKALSCSFCHKSHGVIENLISSPSDTSPPAYICEECIAVCVSIIDDEPRAVGPLEPQTLLDRPLTAQLLAAIEHWIRHESLGVDATGELDAVRSIARLWTKDRP